jgi:predicted dehydrogenase
MYRFHPLHHEAVRLVRQGAIGAPRLIRSDFTAFCPPDDIRWRSALAGGALGDLGFYSVGMSRWLAGSEPSLATAMQAPGGDGVDGRCSFTLGFAGGVLAAATLALDAVFACSYDAIGDGGRLEVRRGGMCAWAGERFLIHLSDGRGTHEVGVGPAAPYQLMVRSFADAVAGRGVYGVSTAETIANLTALDRVRAAFCTLPT